MADVAGRLMKVKGVSVLRNTRPLWLCLLLFVSLFGTINELRAQSDSVHYFPPNYARTITPTTNRLFLSTLETTPFSVTVYNGLGTILGSFLISKNSPQEVAINPTGRIYVDENELNTVFADKGLILQGPKTFAVNIRSSITNHGCNFSSKGLSALGTEFRAGFVYTPPSNGGNTDRAISIGIMASENNTVVNFSNPHGVSFYGSGAGTPTYVSSITLNAGESYVVGCNIGNGTDQVPLAQGNDFNGTLITSTKPIAVNCGNNAAKTTAGLGQDLGYDQIVPVDFIGRDYGLMRGLGNNDAEIAHVVATVPNTDVSVNGVFQTTLANPGDYAIYGGNNFGVDDNMLIETSEDVYIFQTVSGASVGGANYRNGFVFVPPITCLSPTEVYIPNVNHLGNNTGKISLITEIGSVITTTAGTLTGPFPLPVASPWETYEINSIPNNTGVEITGTEPIHVQLGNFGTGSGFNANGVGAAGYYSGFSAAARIIAENICFGDSVDFTAGGAPPDSVHWDFDDGTVVLDTGTTITHLFNDTGTFTVELIAYYQCITDTVYKDIFIAPTPVAGIGCSDVCFGDSVYFQDTSTTSAGIIFSRQWVFGDTTDTSTLQNPVHYYANDTAYTVRLSVENDFGCVDTAHQLVNVFTLPTADFSSPNTCFGLSAQFTNQSMSNNISALNTWSWDVDSNGVFDAFTQNPQYLYPDSGDYSIVLAVADTIGCVDTVTGTIRVHPKPLADFDFSNECFGDSVGFTDNSTDYATSTITTYTWDFNDSDSSNAVNPTHLYTTADSFDVTLIVLTDSGCLDTSTQQVVVYSLPVVGFDFTNVCLNDDMLFTDTTAATTGLLQSWQWDFGDGVGSSSSTDPTYLFGTDGTFDVQLIVTSDTGCSDSVTQTVEVYKLPAVDFTKMNVCNGLQVFPTDTSSSLNGFSLTTWEYDMTNDGVVDYTVPNPSHTYPDTGTYSIELKVTDSYGCADSVVKDVVIHPGPVPGFSFSNVCLGGPMLFSDTSTISNGSLVSWAWDFGDGSPINTDQNPSHLYNSAGAFSINFTVTSDSGCVGNTSGQVSIVVFPLPTANFSSSDDCLDDVSVFTDQSTVTSGSIVAWEWNFGDGSPLNTSQNATHVYADSGIYEVVLRAETNNSCVRADTQLIEIFPLPVPNFGFSPVCFNEDMFFTDSSAYLYSSVSALDWDFSDGNSSNQTNPNHLYAASGLYAVKLVATGANTGCQDSLTKTVEVYQLPDVDFQLSNTCTTIPVDFVDQSTSPNGSPILTWEWDINEDFITDFTDTNITQAFSNPGAVSIQLKLTDSLTCTDSTSKVITIHPEPVAGFSTTTVCAGDPTQFTNESMVSSGNIIQSVWDFGDGGVGSGSNSPNYVFDTAGAFAVQLIVTTNNSCSDTITKTVDVFFNPVPNFGFENVCQDTAAIFTDSSSVQGSTLSNWSWNFGDGTTSTLQDPSHLFPVSSNFNVKLIVESAQGCAAQLTKSITVHPVPEVNFFAGTICEKEPYQFSNLSTIPAGAIDSWSWDFGDGSAVDTNQQPSHIYTAVMPFLVTLNAVSDEGCQASVVKPITMASKPNANFFWKDTCAGTPFTFQDASVATGSTITDWLWDFGDGSLGAIARNPVHIFDSGGFFDVVLQVESNQGCRDTITKQIQSLEAPLVSFIAEDTSGCAPYPVQFENRTEIADGLQLFYTWDFGDGEQSDERDPLHRFPNQTDRILFYDVSLTVTTSNGCSRSVVVPNMIEAIPEALPDFSFLPDPISILSGQVQFLNESFGVNDLFWDFGDGGSSEFVTNPQYTYENPGIYDVTLSIENLFGCAAELTREIVIEAVTTFYVPNAFTPNGDGTNDFFFAKGESHTKDYTMRIFDRWGSLIFERAGADARWSGRLSSGEMAPQGVYVYQINYKDIIDADIQHVGTVTLVRNER